MSSKINTKKENQTLISLAVKCKFINTDQEQKIMSLLIEIYQEDPDYQVVNIFRAKKILPQEKIDFLFALKDHLKIKMLDRRFGEIGVGNRFVTSRHVEDALTLQDTYFRENQKSMKIGDILVEEKKMSPASKTAILLTQDRIQDHLLEQAIYEIATSEMERITINKRFGAVAVKCGYITIEQLNRALKFQKNESGKGQLKRYLGEILKELYQLKDEDILKILKLQQQIEKERLSLEKAVSRYKSEINSNKWFNAVFDFIIAKDKMEAHILRKKESFEAIKPEHFNNWLKLNGIRHGLASDELIKVFLSDSECGDQLKIAQGKPCTPSVDADVKFHFDIDMLDPDENGENKWMPVKKGSVLVEWTPHQPGQPGVDVMGNPILPDEPERHSMICGPGVLQKGLSFVAAQDGILLLFNQRTLVVENRDEIRGTKAITGHIRSDTADEYLNYNLKVEGNVDVDGVVKCHDLSVLGNVLGCLETSGNIDISGKIGEDESFVDSSSFHTIIQSGGSVKVKKNIAQAKVVAEKEISAPKSSVFSSELYAMETILLQNVHSSLEQPSLIQVGRIPNLKVEGINRMIDEETAVLRDLQKQDQLDDLAMQLRKKINVQNDYLERQNVLNYLLQACNAEALRHITSLEQKIQIYEPPGSIDGAGLTTDESALAYLDEILEKVKDLSPDRQKQSLNRLLAEASNMYRAAVNSAQRYSAEYQARHKFIMKKVAQNQPGIDAQKQKIEALMSEKDYLAFRKMMPASALKPSIRVKNMIEKHTIIKGQHTSMVIEESIYGVRIREMKDSLTGDYQIVIDGYYS